MRGGVLRTCPAQQSTAVTDRAFDMILDCTGGSANAALLDSLGGVKADTSDVKTGFPVYSTLEVRGKGRQSFGTS